MTDPQQPLPPSPQVGPPLVGSAGFAGCYAQLVDLCRHTVDLDPGSAAALMDAFNLIADLGPPTRLPAVPRVGLAVGLGLARAQLHGLLPAADTLPQLLALTRADALLATVHPPPQTPTGHATEGDTEGDTGGGGRPGGVR